MKPYAIGVASAAAVGLALLFSPTAYSEETGHGAMHGMAHATPAKREAPADVTAHVKSIEDGVAFMGEAIGDKTRDDLFDSGPTMEKLHEHYTSMEEAQDAIRASLKQTPEQQKEVAGALTSLSDAMDRFHVAVHNRDTEMAKTEVEKAKAAARTIAHAAGAL